MVAVEAPEEVAVEQQIATENGEPVKPIPKSYSDIVKGNRSGESGMVLGYIPQGDVFEISEEEWAEGGQLWKHFVMGTVVSHRPSYGEMVRWAEVNWKAYKPIVTQLKHGVFIFRFSIEEDRLDVLGKHGLSTINSKWWWG